MKKNISAIVMLLAVGVVCCFAARSPWQECKRPPVSILQGHELAVRALGEDAERFYCLGAGILSHGWTYQFSSTDGEKRWVVVGWKGETNIRKEPPEY